MCVVCRHTDFVTALDFHPADDKFFLSGSIDGKVQHCASHAHTSSSPHAVGSSQSGVGIL